MSFTQVVNAAEREARPPRESDEIHALAADLLGDPQVADASIRVEGDTSAFRRAGERELRPYGSSTRFTFTRTSLDLSGFTEDERVTVYARPGAILLVGDDARGAQGVEELLDVRLGVANVPESVVETLDAYLASIVTESVEVTAEGTLAFSVALPSKFVRVLDRNVRPFGDSTAFTVPPDALDRAGLGVGDTVAVSATDGAVLMSASG